MSLKKLTHIAIVKFAAPSIWSDPIVDSFTNKLNRAELNLKISRIEWAPNIDVISEVKAMDPDIVFLSDDLFYDMYASEINKLGKTLLSINLYKSPEDFLRLNNEMGIFNVYPAREIIDIARRFFEIKKLAYIAGPIDGAKKIARIVKEQAPSDLTMSEYYSGDWQEWKNLLRGFTKDYDAIWLVTPFLVKDGDKDLDHRKFANFIEELAFPTIGFCTMSTEFKRTITVGVNPGQLGNAAAEVCFQYLLEGSLEIAPYSSFDIEISHRDMKKFTKVVPEVLLAFVSRTFG